MEIFVPYVLLKKFTTAIFEKIGCSDTESAAAATTLLSADLRGVDSHGIARLSGYVRLWEIDRIDVCATPEIIHQTPSTAVVDGKGGLGLIVAPFAMQVAIEKAKNAGTGWVSVQNSSHYGIAGIHAMMALQHDMIGIAMTNASPTVAPTFSKQKLLGTNPIAVAIPAGEQPAYVADFATTTAANGKLEILQRKNADAPYGWVQTKEGEPTTDANALKNGGALLPLGGDREHGSHKGYMLGGIVDIFSALLSGANYGPFVPPFPAYLPMPAFLPGNGIGHFFGAMRIDAFRPADAFKKDMDDWISHFRNATPIDADRPVLIPGDPERISEKERMEKGVPLPETVLEDLKKLADKFSVPFPEKI